MSGLHTVNLADHALDSVGFEEHCTYCTAMSKVDAFVEPDEQSFDRL